MIQGNWSDPQSSSSEEPILPSHPQVWPDPNKEVQHSRQKKEKLEMKEALDLSKSCNQPPQTLAAWAPEKALGQYKLVIDASPNHTKTLQNLNTGDPNLYPVTRSNNGISMVA